MKGRNYRAPKTAASGAKYETFDNPDYMKSNSFIEEANISKERKSICEKKYLLVQIPLSDVGTGSGNGDLNPASTNLCTISFVLCLFCILLILEDHKSKTLGHPDFFHWSVPAK